jgi:hypothetical protein
MRPARRYLWLVRAGTKTRSPTTRRAFALAEQVAPSATGASVYRTDNATGQSIPPGGYCLPTTAFASIGGIDVYAGLYRTAASNGTTTNDWTSTAPTAASYDVSGMVNYNLYNNGSTAVEVCLHPQTFEYNGGPSTCPGSGCTLIYQNNYGNVCHMIQPGELKTFTISSPTARNPKSNSGQGWDGEITSA